MIDNVLGPHSGYIQTTNDEPKMLTPSPHVMHPCKAQVFVNIALRSDPAPERDQDTSQTKAEFLMIWYQGALLRKHIAKISHF